MVNALSYKNLYKNSSPICRMFYKAQSKSATFTTQTPPPSQHYIDHVSGIRLRFVPVIG